MRARIMRVWNRFDEVQQGSVWREVWYAICAGIALAWLLNGGILVGWLCALILIVSWQRDVAVFEGAKNARIVRKVKCIVKAHKATSAQQESALGRAFSIAVEGRN